MVVKFKPKLDPEILKAINEKYGDPIYVCCPGCKNRFLLKKDKRGYGRQKNNHQ